MVLNFWMIWFLAGIFFTFTGTMLEGGKYKLTTLLRYVCFPPAGFIVTVRYVWILLETIEFDAGATREHIFKAPNVTNCLEWKPDGD